MLPQEIVFVGPDWFALKYKEKGHQREREMHREIGRGFSVQVKKEFPRLFCPSKQVECVCVCLCVRVCVCVSLECLECSQKGLSGHIAECYFSFLLEIQIVLHFIHTYIHTYS